ncbi:helix-turn-helix domain-containing protein [Tenacibaculum sp. TC6]|uniref:helix-turn-helix domain-containing protein n=1 Tax=Tenacibaculum sp. TC6 TaxID=3423223 RepID=UPI003D36DBBB
MLVYKKVLLILSLFFSLNSIINAQDKFNIPDSLTLKSFHELDSLFYACKPDTLKCIVYSKAEYFKALKEKDTMEMLNGKYKLADIKNNDSIYLRFCDSLIEVCKKKPSKNFPAAIYLRKARFFFQKRINSLALNELVEAKKYINIKNNDSINAIRLFLTGLIKSSVGKKREALKYYKNCYTLVDKNNLFYANDDFLSLLGNISLIYTKLDNLDSASYYNKKNTTIYKNLKDTTFLSFNKYINGVIQYKKGNYKDAATSFISSIKGYKDDENIYGLTKIYAYIGETFEYLRDIQNSLKYHLKTDSIYDKHSIKHPFVKKSFIFLINYYENKNNTYKQLEYINKLLEIKEFELTEKNKIQETFTNEFDIPNLLAERKRIVEALETKSKRNQFIYVILLLTFLGIIGYQIRKKRDYKKRFLTLINQENFKSNLPVINKSTENSKSQTLISDEIAQPILQRLAAFEQNEIFLDSAINLQTLASELNTNANYLSKVINQYKNSSFSNYMNKLRIEYAVHRLKKDPLWRKYTIKAIANEVGFKNAESFSKAFYKYTELRPSYFIKELDKVDIN